MAKRHFTWKWQSSAHLSSFGVSTITAVLNEGARQEDMRVILAPSNLGLRPLWEGHEPGTWRAPEVLIEAGLLDLFDASRFDLPRPPYSPPARSRHGPSQWSRNARLQS